MKKFIIVITSCIALCIGVVFLSYNEKEVVDEDAPIFYDIADYKSSTINYASKGRNVTPATSKVIEEIIKDYGASDYSLLLKSKYENDNTKYYYITVDYKTVYIVYESGRSSCAMRVDDDYNTVKELIANGEII